MLPNIQAAGVLESVTTAHKRYDSIGKDVGYPESKVGMSTAYQLCDMSSGLPHVLCIMHRHEQHNSIKAYIIASADRDSENEWRASTGQLDSHNQKVNVMVGILTQTLCASVITTSIGHSQAQNCGHLKAASRNLLPRVAGLECHSSE